MPFASRTFPDIKTDSPAEYWTLFVFTVIDRADWEETKGTRASIAINRSGASFREIDS